MDAGLGLALGEPDLGEGDLHRDQAAEVLGVLEHALGRLQHGGGPQELGLPGEGLPEGEHESGLVLGQGLEPALGMQPLLQGPDALGEVALQQVELAEGQAQAGLFGVQGVVRQPLGGELERLLGLGRPPQAQEPGWPACGRGGRRRETGLLMVEAMGQCAEGLAEGEEDLLKRGTLRGLVGQADPGGPGIGQVLVEPGLLAGRRLELEGLAHDPPQLLGRAAGGVVEGDEHRGQRGRLVRG